MYFKFLTLVVVAAFIVGSLPLLGFVPFISASSNGGFHHTPVRQTDDAFENRSITISNPDFDEPNVAAFSSTITGWIEERNTQAAVSAIINTRDFHSFRDYHNLQNLDFMSYNPGNNNRDDNILALANRTSGGTATVGFTSSGLDFHADGYFMVSVCFYAIVGTSHVYLTPTTEISEDIQTSIELTQISFNNIHGVREDNQSMWRTATFFVRTDARQATSFNLGLFLGTQKVPTGGVIYFDNAQATSLSHSEYHRMMTNRSVDPRFADFIQEIDLRQHDEFGCDQEFDFGVMDFAATSGIPSNSNITHDTTSAVAAILNFEEVRYVHSFTGQQRDVMILSTVDNNVSMRMNDTLTIDRNTLYKISFYSLHNGNASIRIHDPIENDLIDHFDSGFVPIQSTATDASESRNNWTLNTLYITGDALVDTAVEIEFWVGTENANATGWLLVDEFSIVRVSNEYFAATQNDENTTTLRIFESLPGEGILNSNFNVGNVRSAQNAFPLVATDWELTAGSENAVVSGIVNTDPTHFAANQLNGNYGYTRNPGAIDNNDANNNVFMMQNLSTTHQTLTSNSFPLHRGTYNVISFQLARHTIHANMIAFATIETNGIEIARINFPTTVSLDPVWTEYSFGIRASEFTGHEVTISFHLGSNNLETRAGTLFIDDVRIRQANSITRNGLSRNTGVSVDAFADLSCPLSLVDRYGNSLFFRSADDQFTTTFNNNVLLIQSDGHQNGSIVNNLAEELEGGAFFEYTVTARINFESTAARYQRIPHLDDEQNIIAEPNNVDYGISMYIEGFDGGFFNIKPEYFSSMPGGSFAADGFVTYRFFIRTEAAASLSLVINFGDGGYHDLAHRAVWGSVEIREITLTQIDEPQWNNARNTHRDRLRNDERSNFGIITESTFREPTETTPRERGQLDFLIVPSIIMAVAIILALAAFLLRRSKFNLHIGRKHTTYAKDDAGVAGAEEIKAKKVKKTEIAEPMPTPSDNTEQ